MVNDETNQDEQVWKQTNALSQQGSHLEETNLRPSLRDYKCLTASGLWLHLLPGKGTQKGTEDSPETQL